MNNIKSASGEIAVPTTIRVAPSDKKVISEEHTNFSNFINAAIAKEVKRIEKKKALNQSKTKT